MRSGALAALLLGRASSAAANPFDDAIGLWNIDETQASPLRVPNANAATPAGTSLLAAPRRLFGNSAYWTGQSSTRTDTGDIAPDGTPSASTVVGTGNWLIRPAMAGNLPAGQYTLACSVKRNAGSDQSFCLYHGNTANRGATETATASWQRFTHTFTLASPAGIATVGLGSSDGVTDGNVQICDFELFVGAADLGPVTVAGHLYLGSSGIDTAPSYASGALAMSTAYGLLQFQDALSIGDFTVQALLRKDAGGSGYSGILSRVQSYTNFSAMAELTGAPFAYYNGSTAFSPPQAAGMWNALAKGYHVLTVRHDGTKLSWWLDDVLLFNATAAQVSLSFADLLFAGVNFLTSGFTFAGSVALWDRALSNDEVRNAVGRQQARAALSSITATSAPRVLVAEGDSISVNLGANSYPNLYGASASPDVHGVNFAVSGSTVAGLVNRAARALEVIPPSTAGRKFILTCHIGANDLASLGATAWLAAYASYLDTMRAGGFLVAIGTVLPKNSATHNTERATANPVLRTWPGVHCDAVFDFASDATMGPDAAATNPTYYSDGTHPTAAGHAILETVYRPVINAL